MERWVAASTSRRGKAMVGMQNGDMKDRDMQPKCESRGGVIDESTMRVHLSAAEL